MTSEIVNEIDKIFGGIMVEEGKKAPMFTLMDDKGNKVSLKSFTGKKVVLYFYPKDNTSGCTKEALDFGEHYKAYKKLGAEIIGISKDSAVSHQKFRDKYKIPFTLLCDEDTKVMQKYDCWKEKSMYGRKYMGAERSTFIIDEKGKVIKIFRKVKVAGHADAVTEVLKLNK